jgi:ribosome biogenesis protein Tsr3
MQNGGVFAVNSKWSRLTMIFIFIALDSSRARFLPRVLKSNLKVGRAVRVMHLNKATTAARDDVAPG